MCYNLVLAEVVGALSPPEIPTLKVSIMDATDSLFLLYSCLPDNPPIFYPIRMPPVSFIIPVAEIPFCAGDILPLV
jgi:hypothetical protein